MSVLMYKQVLFQLHVYLIFKKKNVHINVFFGFRMYKEQFTNKIYNF